LESPANDVFPRYLSYYCCSEERTTLHSQVDTPFPALSPFFFAGMWLFVTSILAAKSKWFSLMRQYPNRDELPVLRLRFQSGRMSGVSMSGILRLDACPSGLRVGIWRLFGLLSRDFLVPWTDIRVERKTRFLWKVAELQFGAGAGNLTISDVVANRIARAIPMQWPEAGPFPEETVRQAFWNVFKLWAFGTLIAATFFTVAPRLMSPHGPYPPIAVAILFPAIVFGIRAVFSFFFRVRS
jgi:hypothetical protein